MSTADIGIRLSLEGASKTEADLGRVTAGVEKVGTAADSIRTAMARLAGAFAGVVSVQQFVQAADAVTQLGNSLRLATGSATAAGTAYNELFEIAQRSRVDFVGLGNTFASVARAGGELGLSQQRLLAVTEAIGNAMTISGGSAESMNAALVQLGQGIASGTLRGEELNSVMEQTPRLAKAIADGMGVSIGKLRELGAAGQITSDQLIRALESQSAALTGEVQSATLTVGQAMTQLQNATVKTVGDFDKASGASATMAKALSSLATSVQGAGKAFAENETAIKAVLGALGGAATVAGVAALAGHIGKVRVALTALAAVASANPVVLALMGLGAGVGYLVTNDMAKRNTTTVDGIRRAIAELEAANATGPGIYNRDTAGLAAWEKAVAERKAKIAELRVALSQLDAQNLDTRAEEARLAAQNQNAKATGQLAEKYEDLRQRLIGFKGDYNQYTADLKTAQAALAAGQITDRQYIAIVTELAKKHGDVGAAAKKSASEINAVTEAQRASARQWADRLQDFQRIGEAALADADGLTKAESALKSYLESAAYAEDVAKGRQNEVLAAAALALENERLAAATKTLATIQKEAHSAYAQHLEALQRGAEQAVDQVAAMELEAEAADLAAQQNISLAVAIEQVTIARLKEKQVASLADEAAVLAIQKEIEARQKLIGLITNKDAREAGVQAAKSAADEWKRTAQQIEQSLTDALMRAFENGKDFAQALRDTVVNMFKTLVLRPIISAIVNPVATAITAALGIPGAVNAATSVAGLAGAASTATGWLADLSSSIAGVVGQIPVWGWALAGLAAVISSLDDSGTPHAGGMAQYSARGGLSTSTQHGAFGMGFGGVEFSRAGQDFASNVARSLATLLDGLATTFGRTAGYEVAAAFADDASGDGAWGGLRISLNGATVLNWGDNPQSRWAPQEFADGEEGAQQYLDAVAADVAKMIKDMDLPAWAESFTDSLPDDATLEELNAVVAAIAAYPNQLLQAFGISRDAMVSEFAAGLMSGDAAAAGQAVADQVVASIESSMVNTAAAQIFDIVNVGIITPILDALMTGKALTDVLSDAMIQETIDKAVKVAEAMGAILNDPAFADAMRKVREAIAAALGEAGSALGYTPQFQQSEAQEAAAAQERYNQALSQAKTRLQQAESALQNAISAVQSVRDEATGQYLSAQQRVADVQKQIADAANQARLEMDGLAQSLRDFATGGLEQPTQRFADLLTKALAGDKDAMSGLTEAATSAIDASRLAAATGADARLAEARIRADVIRAANVAASLGGGVDNTETELQQQLIEAQAELASALQVANAIGAPLTRSVSDLIARFNEAMARQEEAQAEYDAAKAALDAIQGNTAATTDAVIEVRNSLTLTRTSIIDSLTTGFSSIDLNTDGLLSFEEFAATMAGKASDAELRYWFDQLDRNHDGFLTQAELIAANTRSTAADLQALRTGATMVVGFSESDPLRSVFNNISRTNELLIDGLQLQLLMLTGYNYSEQLEPLVKVQWGTYEMTNRQLEYLLAIYNDQADILDRLARVMVGTAVLHVTGASGGGGGTTTVDFTATNNLITAGNASLATIASNTSGANTRLDTHNSHAATANNLLQQGVNWDSTFNGHWLTNNNLLSAIYSTTSNLNTNFANVILGYGSLLIRGATTAFAQGGVFTNSVVSSPTLFNMGLMGEAGPEAIMPLARTANGDLGVQVQMPDWSQYGGGGASAALLAEIRALRQSNEALRSDNQAQASSLVQMQQELLRLHKRWDGAGLPETRVTA